MEEWIKSLGLHFNDIHQSRKPYVCRKEIYTLLNNWVNLLYPSRCEELRENPDDWSTIVAKLTHECLAIFQQLDIQQPEKHTRSFMENLPQVKNQLDQDATYFASQDPAAESLAEIILCYPGFLALTIYRLAHQLYQQKIPLLPRIISEYAHERTGIDIHPGAHLGCPLFIDHGTGIVIGETCEIGSRVKIFQGVTLGAPSVHRRFRGSKRHPTVGNDVILYANATILGGQIEIGHNSIIGGNVWISETVPPNSRIYYEFGKSNEKRNRNNNESINLNKSSTP